MLFVVELVLKQVDQKRKSGLILSLVKVGLNVETFHLLCNVRKNLKVLFGKEVVLDEAKVIVH